jgi:hypothetical protein
MQFDLEKQEDRHEAHHVSRLFEVKTVLSFSGFDHPAKAGC